MQRVQYQVATPDQLLTNINISITAELKDFKNHQLTNTPSVTRCGSRIFVKGLGANEILTNVLSNGVGSTRKRWENNHSQDAQQRISN